MCSQKTNFDIDAGIPIGELGESGEQVDKQARPEKPKAISHPDYEELEAALNQAEAQLNAANTAIENYKAEQLRGRAELDNIRKRAEKDVQNAYKYGLERFVTELLPIIDSLECGMNMQVNENELAKQIHAGMEMTHKLLIDSLEKFSIEPINPFGDMFNPALHQVISTQEEKNTPENTVLQVLQKGYSLNGRLIRPALVVVAK